MPITSSLLSKIRGLTHGFGDRAEPIPASFNSQWAKSSPFWKQTHGIGFANVVAPKQECGEVDSLYTNIKSLPIAVVTADCVPIILGKKDGKGAAVVHAGWRGTHAKIVRALWSKLHALGESPENWVAAIGPAIGPCCYEVSEDLAKQFETTFGNLSKGLAVPTHRHLDLPAINAEELREIGVAEIDLIRACTRCTGTADHPTYHSYRREGGGTRQFSIAALT